MNRETNELRAVIADDEELARCYLKELLADHPDVRVVAECRDGFAAVAACAELNPDLLFLDIQMPGLDGFEVIELTEPQIRVIFITAYDQYALHAFAVHAADYLLKPFSKERLKDALEQIRRRSAGDRAGARDIALAAREGGTILKRIAIKDSGSVILIPTADLDYVRAEDDYVSLHVKGTSYLKHQPIADLEQRLDPKQFVRIHRSAIAQIDRIAQLEAASKDAKVAILRDGTRLPVSKSGYKRLKQILGEL